MFKKLSQMLAVVAAAIMMLTAVGTAAQAEEAVTGDTFLTQIVGDRRLGQKAVELLLPL